MTGADTPALLAALAEGPGAALLAGLPEYDEAGTFALVARLRGEGHDPDLVAAALTQSRLRAAARPRLGPLADRLLLTQDGLEQATRPVVARRRAERLAASGVGHVWDLGCGLGLDSLALAEAGLRVMAVERDPGVAAAARANLAAHPGVEVRVGDAEEVVPGGDEGAVLDPARRTAGVADARGRTRRTMRLEELSPSWEHVQRVGAGAAATGAKMSPTFPRASVPAGCEAEWVSVDGGVVECALWWGAAVRRPGRRAVVGRPDGAVGTRWHEIDAPTHSPDPLSPDGELAAFLAEPDRAVVAAGRADALAALTGGQELDEGVGYVTAGEVVPLPWASWYAVRERLPLHAKVVRGWLRERGAGRVTIKKRGVTTDPDLFRRELRLRGGGEEAVLLLTRVGGSPAALVLDPLDRPGAGPGTPPA